MLHVWNSYQHLPESVGKYYTCTEVPLKFHRFHRFDPHLPSPRDAVQFRRMVQGGDVIRADPEAAPGDVHLGRGHVFIMYDTVAIQTYVCIYM